MRISGNEQQDLVTQIYFKGDSHLTEDESSSDPRSIHRILDISKNAKNERVVRFDVYLKEEYVLDAVAFKKLTGLYEMKDKSMTEFYRDGDQLFAKVNGQIMEAMDYKGNNSFEGGLSYIKAQFELANNGVTKVKVIFTENKKPTEIEGTKILKY